MEKHLKQTCGGVCLRINITSGFKLKALADFPTLSRSHIISFIAKSSLSFCKERNKDDITVCYMIKS